MTQSNMPLKKLKQLQEQMAAQSAQQSLMAPSQVSSNKEDDEEDILVDAEEEEELGADVSARLAALRKSFVSDGVEEKTEKEVVDVDDASSEEEEEDNSNDDAQEVEKKKDEESDDDEEEEEDVGLQARVDSLKARIASAIGKSSQESATTKAAAPSSSGLNALAGYSDSDSDNEEEEDDDGEEEKAHPAATDPAIANFFNEIKEIS